MALHSSPGLYVLAHGRYVSRPPIHQVLCQIERWEGCGAERRPFSRSFPTTSVSSSSHTFCVLTKPCLSKIRPNSMQPTAQRPSYIDDGKLCHQCCRLGLLKPFRAKIGSERVRCRFLNKEPGPIFLFQQSTFSRPPDQIGEEKADKDGNQSRRFRIIFAFI